MHTAASDEMGAFTFFSDDMMSVFSAAFCFVETTALLKILFYEHSYKNYRHTSGNNVSKLTNSELLLPSRPYSKL